MQCKNCGSDNTQRLAVAYQNGTSTVNATSRSVGAGFGTGGAAFGSATTTTSGVSRSLLAARAAPPAKKRYRTAFIIPVIMLFIALFFEKTIIGYVLVISAYVLLVFFLVRFYRYNSSVWPGLYRHWQSMWVCHKCGNIYSEDQA